MTEVKIIAPAQIPLAEVIKNYTDAALVRHRVRHVANDEIGPFEDCPRADCCIAREVLLELGRL